MILSRYSLSICLTIFRVPCLAKLTMSSATTSAAVGPVEGTLRTCTAAFPRLITRSFNIKPERVTATGVKPIRIRLGSPLGLSKSSSRSEGINRLADARSDRLGRDHP